MTLNEYVECGILVKVEPAELPAARVVALSPWRAHFFRGVYYGAVSTLMHMVCHWLGIW